ncbi:MAG: hypothetical protein ACRDFB_05775, partial [Rhabdochlamydiaceae bacterium]
MQNALIKTAGIVEIHLPSSTYKINTSPENNLLKGGFGASEHVAIGEAVKLKELKKENLFLFTRGVTQIYFQHILALAGDFYGIAGEAISLPGGTDLEKTERFKKSFYTLYRADPDELRSIYLEMEAECRAVNNSSLPHHCYSSQMMDNKNKIKRIKNDIDALLIDNSDHFSTHAEDAYRIGHTLALNVAREAGRQNNLDGLKQAYALDAFACHFLTDLFAAGHVRNQRGELESFLISQLGFPKDQAKPFAGLLTGAQHEKDGNEGLNVANKRGDHWRAFGDGNFFAPKNTENKEKVIATTQASVDEIHHAYLRPDSLEPSIIDQLIAHATSFNPLPLYSIEGTSLFLYQGSQKIKIETKVDYLSKGLPHALRYLPEEYINGFVEPFHIEIPPLISKVVIPQIERLTGSVWHMIGLATYYQIKQDSHQLNEKIDELADVLIATHANSLKILQEIQNVNAQLKQLGWDNLFREIQDSIAIIKDKAYEYKTYKKSLNQPQLQRIEQAVRDAYIRISRVFCEGTVDNKEMLIAYTQMLNANT